MKTIFFHQPENNAYSYYRVVLPYMHCKDTLREAGIELIAGKTIFDLSCDAYILHGISNAELFEYLRKLKKNANIVWMVDDDWSSLPEWNPHHPLSIYKEIALIEMENIVDHVVCTTEPLKMKYDNSYYCPNLMMIKEPPKKRENRKLLWSGGNTHKEDLRLLEDVKDITFYGSIPETRSYFDMSSGLPKPTRENDTYVPFTRWDFYNPILNWLDCGIGLAPLVDCPFNECKSNLKYLEYSHMSMATVASPVRPFLEGELTKVKDDWNEAIESVGDDDGLIAYEDVKNNWSWNSWKRDLWLEMFGSVV